MSAASSAIKRIHGKQPAQHKKTWKHVLGRWCGARRQQERMPPLQLQFESISPLLACRRDLRVISLQLLLEQRPRQPQHSAQGHRRLGKRSAVSKRGFVGQKREGATCRSSAESKRRQDTRKDNGGEQRLQEKRNRNASRKFEGNI